AGDVINDTLVPYGDFDTNVVQYYFDAGNGFSAVVSLEEGAGDGSGLEAVGTIDSYVPHVVGGVKWTQGWGGISGVASYDSNYDEFAGKVRLDVNVSSALSLFVIGGYGTDSHLTDSGYDRGFYKQWGGHWAFWAGGTYKVNEKTALNLQVSGDQFKNYGVAANVAYEVVPGLKVTGEVDYLHDGRFGQPDNSNWTGATKKNSVGGILRFQRSF
ncbi:porin, partial [Mesorhizobium sp. B2-4-12]